MIETVFAKLSKRERIIFIVAAIFIFIAAMDRIIMGPVLGQMGGLDEEIASKREKIKQDRRILAYQERILQEYSKYSGYLDAEDQDREEIISALLNKIETSARQESITIHEVRPGDVEDKNLYHIYKTIIECEGTLSNLLAFMHLLEQSDYLFQITQFGFSAKSKDAQTMKARLDVARTLIAAEHRAKAPEAERADEEQ